MSALQSQQKAQLPHEYRILLHVPQPFFFILARFVSWPNRSVLLDSKTQSLGAYQLQSPRLAGD